VNEKNQPFISMSKNNVGSIYCDYRYGPVFGKKLSSDDISIASDSNMNTTSYSVLANSFERTGLSHDAQFILAGSRGYFFCILWNIGWGGGDQKSDQK